MAFKKFFHLFVIPTVQNLSFRQVPKKVSYIKMWTIKKNGREYFKVSKMTVGTGSWRPAAENAIPCVEIEQHRKKKSQKRCFCKVSQFFGVKK